MTTERPLRVAVIGAGPAGTYAADILSKSNLPVSIDIIERLPAPFGLVRYGVAPDHPRIKQIIVALANVLSRGDIRLLANVNIGTDLTLQDLREHYDAVIFATGSFKDADLNIPGIDLEGSFGAADFVSWYDGHPDVPRTWPLTAKEVAVFGVGNVALDVARILAKHPQDLAGTDIPENVMEALKTSPVTDVHVFGRRGPAQVKFSPLELRELGHVPDVDVIVYPEDYDFDEGSMAAVEGHHQTKQVVKTLTDWTLREPTGASRRIHLHFLQAPHEVLGEDGKVTGVRVERTALTGDGNSKGTGGFIEYSVQAVYRAVGYYGTPIEGIPFDESKGTIANVGGRVVAGGDVLPGYYTTGWIKRGPVGLIGSTKSDAAETIENLVEDADRLFAESEAGAEQLSPDNVMKLLKGRGVPVVQWKDWEVLDAFERATGEAEGRERLKVVPREDMTDIALGRD
ncbi:FAD-dependent oxidoreductase [Demequina sp. TTPB684]|uniref:FAD-dependent oxidoreductase n=1 Tax=unclassified Demequina TaxID=2620311 RepID=UPI001CF58BE4|nr:FAD-dependent oxidoreductase [Demequina sp. TMPB413]MCB2412974.1 FAD-dependent oxidoreductase [Demequina sp. TTPB684]UPU88338.1 FAD-dependent oxidoreductase [Demequina sp. TMPB413]